MGKLIIFILIIAVVFFGGMYYQHTQTIPVNTKEAVNNTIDNRLEDMQSELDTYKQKEQEEKLRKMELEQLQNPEIINTELVAIGDYICYKGQTKYSDIIRESNFFGSKEMNIELHYNFGIGIDISKITVKEFIEDKVILSIPKSDLILKYVELDSNSSKINGAKTWFSDTYDSNDAKIVIDSAEKEVKNNLTNNKEYFDKALVNLKQLLTNKILELGFSEILFEEI